MYDLVTLEVLNEQFEEKLKQEELEEKFEKSRCICEYPSPGASALHAAFHGIDTNTFAPMMPKLRNPNCPVHYSGNE